MQIYLLFLALIASCTGKSLQYIRFLTYTGFNYTKACNPPVLFERFENVSALATAGWDGDYFLQGYAAIDNYVSSFDGGWFWFGYRNGPNQKLFTPVLNLTNGLSFFFYTISSGATIQYPDRLDVLYSASGPSTNITDFTTLLIINENLTNTGYPYPWTKITISIPPTSATGRILFHYNLPDVTDYGYFVSIDNLVVVEGPPTCLPQLTICPPLLTEGFNSLLSALPSGWYSPTIVIPDSFSVYIPDNQDQVFPNTEIPAFFNSLNGFNQTLFTPLLNFSDGVKLSFYTRTNSNSSAERLCVLYSKYNTTNPKDFTRVLVTVNKNATIGGFPTEWKKYEGVIPGQKNVRGRVMFWYENLSTPPIEGTAVAIDSVMANVLNCGKTVNLTSGTTGKITTGLIIETTGKDTTGTTGTTSSNKTATSTINIIGTTKQMETIEIIIGTTDITTSTATTEIVFKNGTSGYETVNEIIEFNYGMHYEASFIIVLLLIFLLIF